MVPFPPKVPDKSHLSSNHALLLDVLEPGIPSNARRWWFPCTGGWSKLSLFRYCFRVIFYRCILYVTIRSLGRYCSLNPFLCNIYHNIFFSSKDYFMILMVVFCMSWNQDPQWRKSAFYSALRSFRRDFPYEPGLISSHPSRILASKLHLHPRFHVPCLHNPIDSIFVWHSAGF